MDTHAVEDRIESVQRLVGDRVEFGAQAELVDDVQRRRMHGVAAEVAEEVGVLLEDDHLDAGAGEQEAQHDARRSATGDAHIRRQHHRPDSAARLRRRVRWTAAGRRRIIEESLNRTAT